MGLCKCPKKKVTNLFCFEHRVNVCEHCLVSNHPKCIVQSYLQWLQDSDYDPTCRLCGKRLAGEDVGDCVRLMCYDVFHWSCLDHYARQLPANTAPAGYSCPICKSGVFPGHNVASPVAEAFREVLIKVNWARVGLGLPLIEERPPPGKSPETGNAVIAGAGHQIKTIGDIPSTHTHANMSSSNLSAMDEQSPTNAAPSRMPVYTPGGAEVRTPVAPPAVYSANIPDSVISMDAAPYTRMTEKDFLTGHPADPRKLFDSTKGGDYMNASHDHDEDKYKRRPALQWFARWFSSRNSKQRKDPNATCKKFAIIIVIGLIGFLTVIMIFSKLGRASADNDPFLDPMANPHIQVKDSE